MNQAVTPQDPLSQLRDIHLPEPISWWPPAPGWWILAIVILATLFFAVRWFIRYRAKNCYRREAMEQLHQITAATDNLNTKPDNLKQCQALLSLLRRTAKTAYPILEQGERALESETTASLFSKLNLCCKKMVFDDGLQNNIGQLLYQANPDISDALLQQLQQATAQWIKQHRHQYGYQSVSGEDNKHRVDGENNNPSVSGEKPHANP